jgi:UDP-glucose 4-epimerase
MILVTGGAGYIGSHVAKELLVHGNDVLILDNLSTGHRQTVDQLQLISAEQDGAGALSFVLGDTGDRDLLCSLLRDYKITALIHLAAFSQVGESMIKPGKYFENNVARAINILECMAECGVRNIVFSSTAAVYGEPIDTPIIEEHPTRPTNVYGASKLMVEEILRWYDQIYGIKHVALRYFNAAGADESGLIGENHDPETHLVPLVIQKVLGQRDKLTVFGDDYPTPDGTCLRDYIHVTDLATAHILALGALENGMDSKTFNLGNGSGYSVKEVIDTVAEVAGESIGYEIGARRAGDPAVLVASSDQIKAELGWVPQYPQLKQIIATAWKWHGK